MIIPILLLAVGFVLLITGGDWFVDSASWFAEVTGIPKFVVGATIVSFATTLPELLVSVRAAMNGSAQLAIGNAVGSVTANTTLIMGVSLVAIAGVVSRKEFSLKGGLLLAAIIGLTVLSLGGLLPVHLCPGLHLIMIVPGSIPVQIQHQLDGRMLLQIGGDGLPGMIIRPIVGGVIMEGAVMDDFYPACLQKFRQMSPQ